MNTYNPFVSVFTPNYNNSKYLSETIESILNQEYSNFEYIIIDDYSTDQSWELIKNYAKKDSRIKCFRNGRNLGIVKTRNKGFKYRSSKSKYYAIIDSDDISLSDRLKIQVDFLEKNQDYGLVGSNALIINEESKIISYRKYPTKNNQIKKLITLMNPFAQSSITLERTALIKSDYMMRIGMFVKIMTTG